MATARQNGAQKNMSEEQLSKRVEAVLGKKGVVLTMGAEPTCLPLNPVGAEWSFAAAGPEKLAFARELAASLVKQCLPGALTLFAPGKTYPGEVNPRWAVHLVSSKDGMPLAQPHESSKKAAPRDAEAFLSRLGEGLRIRRKPVKLHDPLSPRSPAFVLPIDGDGRKWTSPKWKFPRGAELTGAEGPAGLRLPMHLLDTDAARRAITAQVCDGNIEIFLPPLLQEAWMALLAEVDSALARGRAVRFAGYVPEDTLNLWTVLTLAADPGVLEINLPACRTWQEYDQWLQRIEIAQESVGLRTWKIASSGYPEGTGGGHHVLLGGASTEEDHPFFTRPGWLVSILRFWQHHPSLAYLFTGRYVGASSQAPRPDESAKSLWDLEMAYAWLEGLPAGEDHRLAMAGALIHLHSDTSGNTHRSEISFDKFWNVHFPGGTRGLVEFRALESLPNADWSSSVALLWRSLAAHLLENPFTSPLRDFSDSLHDRFLLPSVLWADFESVLNSLRDGGFFLNAKTFRAIQEWRFPCLLTTPDGLCVRRGLESWPLLCETPIDGGNTSRFVDTSMERLEFSAPESFAAAHTLRINGRELPLCAWKSGVRLSGLRCRRSALNPSLHPGMPVQFPLVLEIEGDGGTRAFILKQEAARFRKLPEGTARPPTGKACRRPSKTHFSFDLRLPA
jgi:uncharacterized protein (DUF2126 family)